MEISFQHDIKRLTADLERIDRKAIPAATVQAINKTLGNVKTLAAREVSNETGIAQKSVKEDLRVWKASKQKQIARINARAGKAKNLIAFVNNKHREVGYFNHRKTLKSGRRGKYRAQGVKAKAWGKSTTYRGTFIGRGKNSGKLLVFARKGDARTPVKSILGPSVRATFDNKRIQTKLQQAARSRFNVNFDAAIKNKIRLAKARAARSV